MAQYLRLALALSSVPSGSPLHDSSSCNVTLLKGCYGTYLENFNLTTNPAPSYVQYARAKNVFIGEHGLSAQKEVCQWQHDLENCLGQSISSCITREAIQEALNVSNTDALLYQTDFDEDQYQCGDGYEDLLKYFDCYQNVQKERTEQFIACAKKFKDAVQKGGFKCSYLYDLMSCTGSIFTQECGPGISKLICNTQEAVYEPLFHQCDGSWPKC
ncbi:hypothetical protein QR680_003664 [Steinernema hermaphroditum]|uniref:DUF19 domain-containing protein n=1 Tax=Steinernema hermaphroditum TaxID=289476 RepID=A0AA39HM53_9BILA|nr:hypothetical protein QR680_003664 [Steinernema hermaphroditum]